MARTDSDRETQAVYKAAQTWMKRCLLGDGSMLSEGKNLWTHELLDTPEMQKFTKNYRKHKGSFYSKLRKQTSKFSLSRKQLIAECLWLMFLFPTNMDIDTKRDRIIKVWSWSDEDVNSRQEALSDEVLIGIGSTGANFGTRRWRELALLIDVVRQFKTLSRREQKRLSVDPWEFSSWFYSIPSALGPQIGHIISHLLFPDHFERLSAKSEKIRVLSWFNCISENEVGRKSMIEIDKNLLILRNQLEKSHGKEIDFYQEDLAKLWRPRKWLFVSKNSRGLWNKLPTGRDNNMNAKWICTTSKPKKGDHVYVIESNKDKIGIAISGVFTCDAYKDDTHEINKNSSDEKNLFEKIRFIDVLFDDIRDINGDDAVSLYALKDADKNQNWYPDSGEVEIRQEAARALHELWASSLHGSTPLTDGADAPTNLILYGPPGTGKTRELSNNYIPHYTRGRFEFITFHQSYAYEDFVEGIRPETEDGGIKYEVRWGPLRRICDRAMRAPNKRFALFIDEINRGNVAKIFGELITLVEADKRIRTDASGERLSDCKGLTVTLPYSGDTFGVPVNVDVIGTMNTADRSIALLDSALRRRFEFEELAPQPELLGSISDGNGGQIDLQRLLETMNARLTHLRHRDQTLGHSYLIHVESFEELRLVFEKKILPFLQEVFYDDWQQIRLVLSDDSVEREDLQLIRRRSVSIGELFPGADPSEISDRPMFEIAPVDEITPEAIRKIYETPE